MIIIGIDPGQKGGIAAINSYEIFVQSMPDTVKGIVEAIRIWKSDAYLVVERAQAMPRQGVTGVFSYGQHYGGFEAIAACFGIPFMTVRPQEWKKAMGLNSDKTSSIIECERLFPQANIYPTPRCKKPSDGMAEALLIAEWGRRKLGF